MIFWVGCPASSSSQWRLGLAQWEFRIGSSKKALSMINYSPPVEILQ
jgi:hypothetical protein